MALRWPKLPPSGMSLPTLGAVVSFFGQLAAGAATLIWPNQPWIAQAIFFGSAGIMGAVVVYYLATNYKFRSPIVSRRPNLRRQLAAYVLAADELIERPIKSESDLSKFNHETARWLFRVIDWVDENMGKAALSVFQDLSNVLPMTHSGDFNDDHRKRRNTITKHRDNLKRLIENDAWHRNLQ